MSAGFPVKSRIHTWYAGRKPLRGLDLRVDWWRAVIYDAKLEIKTYRQKRRLAGMPGVRGANFRRWICKPIPGCRLFLCAW